MIRQEDIRAQALRGYGEYLSSLAKGASIFPIELRFSKVRSGEAVARFEELREELAELRRGSDEDGKASYRVEWDERRDRLAGTQRFPVRVSFPNESALLTYLGKRAEAEAFKRDLDILSSVFPGARGWAATKPRRLVEHAGDWERIVATLEWMRHHPKPGIFLREIPAVEDTKFIEAKKGLLRELIEAALPELVAEPEASNFEERFGFRRPEPLIRLRVLDAAISSSRLSGLADISVPAGDLDGVLFPELTTILIFENKTNFANAETFLTLPAMAGCMAIFGSGFAVRALAGSERLRKRKLLYWGDIDTQGFRILATLRRSYPDCQSLLMDEETFDQFPEYRTEAPAEAYPAPEGLSDAEARLYARLAGLERRNRLEQERVPTAWARSRLERLLG